MSKDVTNIQYKQKLWLEKDLFAITLYMYNIDSKNTKTDCFTFNMHNTESKNTKSDCPYSLHVQYNTESKNTKSDCPYPLHVNTESKNTE